MTPTGFAPPKSGLTVAMRSCLLRAARSRLAQLHEDYDALTGPGRPDVGGQRDILFHEVACVTAAIAWLWLQPASDDGG